MWTVHSCRTRAELLWLAFVVSKMKSKRSFLNEYEDFTHRHCTLRYKSCSVCWSNDLFVVIKIAIRKCFRNLPDRIFYHFPEDRWLRSAERTGRRVFLRLTRTGMSQSMPYKWGKLLKSQVCRVHTTFSHLKSTSFINYILLPPRCKWRMRHRKCATRLEKYLIYNCAYLQYLPSVLWVE